MQLLKGNCEEIKPNTKPIDKPPIKVSMMEVTENCPVRPNSIVPNIIVKIKVKTKTLRIYLEDITTHFSLINQVQSSRSVSANIFSI